ncbi:MAG: nitrogen fixation protein NifZ [Xanthobacteraceae bacterium]
MRQTSKMSVAVPRVRANRNTSRRRVALAPRGTRRREFEVGETVRVLTLVRNDGLYPRKDIGEIVVQRGDAGRICESWSFLGEIYYTVKFAALATVVIMRGCEMERAPRG